MKLPAGSVRTARLVLRPLTPDLARAILAGDPTGRRWAAGYPTDGDRTVAGLLLQAPASARADDAIAACGVHFGLYEVVLRPDLRAPDGHPSAEAGLTVGGIGFFGPPGEDGQVELGYGMAESVRGRGLATEAVLALVEAASRDARVVAVRARVSADNPASLRVVHRTGFAQTGHDDSDPAEPLLVYTRPIEGGPIENGSVEGDRVQGRGLTAG